MLGSVIKIIIIRQFIRCHNIQSRYSFPATFELFVIVSGTSMAVSGAVQVAVCVVFAL